MPSNVDSSRSEEEKELNKRDLTTQVTEGNSWSGNERNCLFLNYGKDRFATASYTTGFDFKDDGRGIALVDWDCDGDLDMWLSNRHGPQTRYLENQTTNSKWVSLKLEGDGLKVNRDAIGATVIFWIKDEGKLVPLKRDVACGDSFLSQSTRWLNVGLGKANLIRIEVKWPDGSVDEFDAPEIKKHYTLKYAEGKLKMWIRPSAYSLSGKELPEPVKQNNTIKLVKKYPFPPVIFFGSNKLITPLKKGGNQLLKFWSADCDICKEELLTIVSKHALLSEANIELKLINVDADQRGFPAYNQAKAPGITQLSTGLQGVNVMEAFMNATRIFHSDFKFPLAVLVDSEGNVVSFYEGTLDYDTVIKDALLASKNNNSKFRNAIPFDGVMNDEIIDALHPYIASKFANNKYKKYAGKLLESSDEKTKNTVSYKLVLSELYLNTRRGAKAVPLLLDVLKEATKRNRRKIATRNLGMAYMDAKQMDKAEKTLIESGTSFDDARSYYQLARLMFLTKRKDKVEECLIKSVDLCEQQGLNFDLPWKKLLAIYKSEGRKAESDVLIKRALGLGIKL